MINYWHRGSMIFMGCGKHVDEDIDFRVGLCKNRCVYRVNMRKDCEIINNLLGRREDYERN